MRRNHRPDDNQDEIVKALRKIGVSVEVIGKPLDLLICHRFETSLMEVKAPESKGHADEFTKDQIEFMARWPGKIHVVRTIEEAMTAVLGKEAMA